VADDPRVQQLLDQLFDSNLSPEVVCQSCPELLPVVRERWRQMCRVHADLDALFPPSDDATPALEAFAELTLPQISGYEVEAVLGRGGMGIVFLARHLRLKRRVALKMALNGAYAGTRERARFQREAEAVAGLRHPNIVQIYEIGEADGRPYFTMELVEGGSLSRKLAGTPQPARQAAELMATLAPAVQAAHACGIVHRDLKPANVLLAIDGTPKISDFGLARRATDGAGLTQTGAALGTPSYMAPEQALQQPDAIGPAVDVYALGAMLYELLTGRPPFRAASAAETVQQVIAQEPAPPSRLNDKVPRDLETICLKCLRKDPSRRYDSAAHLADDLRRYLRGEPILARRSGMVERSVKWVRRHPSLAAFIVSGALLLLVVLAVGWSTLVARAVVSQMVDEDFRQVARALERQSWSEARTALERAKARLGNSGPRELLRKAEELNRALSLVGHLEEIRLRRASIDWRLDRDGGAQFAYARAFRDARLADGQEDPALVAARIRATHIAPALLVAVDDWEVCDSDRRSWLHEVARHVDQNPITRQIRDLRVWNDKNALMELTRSIGVERESVPFLPYAGNRLHELGEDPSPFLMRVQHANPGDFWANYLLAVILHNRGNPGEAIRYYQAAVALEPSAYPRGNLGIALGSAGHLEDGLHEIQIALRTLPDSAHYHFAAGASLCLLRRFDEAMPELARACEIEPKHPKWRLWVGVCLADQNRHAEAIDAFQQTIALDSKYSEAFRRLGDSLLQLKRWEEARVAWEQCVALDPPEQSSWDAYAELCLYLGNETEYRHACQDLLRRFGGTTDPQVAERTGRACLLLPPGPDVLRQAEALIDRALSADRIKLPWQLPYFRFAKALAEYRREHHDRALALLDADTQSVLGPAPGLLLAMVECRLGQTDNARHSLNTAISAFDWDPAKAINREAWMNHLLRREAEGLLARTPVQRRSR
jgi:serine/threonine-protein kinase